MQLLQLPLTVLRRCLNGKILVKLKDGKTFVGRLESIDDYMNLVISGCYEVNDNGEPMKKYGKSFLRGNNVIYIVTDFVES